MERRRFIKGAGIAGVLAAGIAPAVQAGQAIRWRLASRFSKALDIPHGGLQSFIHTVKELSAGRFEISLISLDDLPSASGVLDSVQRGSIECGHTYANYYLDKDETFALDAAIPFGLNARQMNAWLQEGNGLALLREFYRGHGIVNFPLGNTGPQLGGWYRKPIRSLNDFKGMKIRIVGLGAEILKRHGALPSTQKPGEIYKALESRRIDAAEWGTPYDDLKLGIDRVARYCVYPGCWEGGSQMSLYVNHRAYDALNDENQAILEAAAAMAHQDIQSRYDAHVPEALKELVAAGAQLVPLPQAVVDALYKTARGLYAEIGGRNPRWKKIYASYAAFARPQAWSGGFTEMAYAGLMHRIVQDEIKAEQRKSRR